MTSTFATWSAVFNCVVTSVCSSSPEMTEPSLEANTVMSALGGKMAENVEERLSITAVLLTSSSVEILTIRMKKARTRR